MLFLPKDEALREIKVYTEQALLNAHIHYASARQEIEEEHNNRLYDIALHRAMSEAELENQ